MLSFDRAQEIEQLTSDLLLDVYGSYGNITPPVDLSPILHRYRTRILLTDFEEPDIAGKLEIQEGSQGFNVLISRKDSFQRQSFSIAHELGHIILHPHHKVDVYRRSMDFSKGNGTSLLEQEANRFAAAILMPRETVKTILKITNNAQEIADIFKVSISTCKIRLENLGVKSV